MKVKDAVERNLNVARRSYNVAGRNGMGQEMTWDCGCRSHSTDGIRLCQKHTEFPRPLVNGMGSKNVHVLEDAGMQGACWVEVEE